MLPQRDEAPDPTPAALGGHDIAASTGSAENDDGLGRAQSFPKLAPNAAFVPPTRCLFTDHKSASGPAGMARDET